jgi:hypothetical protein
MDIHFLFDHPWELGLLTWLSLALVIEAGYQSSKRFGIEAHDDHKAEIKAVHDGILLLVSLLLGFTLAQATPRHAERRVLFVDEANAIGTTYLRAGTLPQPYRNQAQQLLRKYVDERLEFDSAGLNQSRATRALIRARQIQEQLWQGLIEVNKQGPSVATVAYMNSLNELIDLDEKRIAALENRIPASAWLLIYCASTVAAFTRGLSLVRRFWITLVIVPLTIGLAVALIADLDTPRSGLIQIDERAMQRLQAEMRAPTP